MEDDGGAGGQRAGPYLAGLPGSAARQHRQALRGRGRASLAGPGSGGGTSSLRATNSRRFLPRGRGQLLARDRRNSPTPCKKPSCRGQGRGWASGAVPGRFRFPRPNCADLAQNVSEPREMGGGFPPSLGVLPSPAGESDPQPAFCSSGSPNSGRRRAAVAQGGKAAAFWGPISASTYLALHEAPCYSEMTWGGASQKLVPTWGGAVPSCTGAAEPRGGCRRLAEPHALARLADRGPEARKPQLPPASGENVWFSLK